MFKRLVISIIDDDPSLREALLDLMSSLGFAAEAFASAQAFLESGALERISCLVADVQMPSLSGLELHSRLLASGRAIPTILITAYPNETRRARALKAGIIRYLVKPFSDDDLITAIQSAIGLPKAS
jgi:FixJ family two-component response regulator